MTDPSIILELDQARREAMIRADVATLAAMFADDMVWIRADARLDTKESLLGDIASGKTRYVAIECTDETARIYGGVAFLSGVATAKAEIAGELHEIQNRYTIVWAPDGDGWKVVNWQFTSAPEAA